MPARAHLTLIAAILSTMLGPCSAVAAPGDPDLGFGDHGVSRQDFPVSTIESVDDIAVQADGKLVVAGGVDYLSAEQSWMIIRHLPDGGLDPSFGTGGFVRTDFPGTGDFPYDVLVQPDGKIVAGGGAAASTLALARWDATGVLDPSFGTGGQVMASLGASSSDVFALALQPDGKLLTAGGMHLARFAVNGVLDPSFGSGGEVALPFYTTTLVLQPDGAIVVAGSVGGSVALARYDGGGVPDASFGLGGTVYFAVVEDVSSVTGLARQPDGALVAGGTTVSDSGYITRFTSAGLPDLSFGTSGVTLISIPGTSLHLANLIVTDDGIVSAAAPYSQIGPLRMFRHRFDGTIDSSFGAQGIASLAPLDSGGGDFEVAVQPDGKLLAVNSVWSNGPGFTSESVVVRFAGGSTLGCSPAPLVGCTSPGVAGKSTLDLKRSATGKSNALRWKWRTGPAGSFGDPLATDDYAFCLYDESTMVPSLVFEARAPAGGICKKTPCWRTTGSGAQYKDTARTPQGLALVKLASTSAGEGKLAVQGHGTTLLPPTPPLGLPLRAQLHGEHGVCWEATYGAAGVIQNVAGKFAAHDTP